MTSPARLRAAGAGIRDWWLDPDQKREEASNSLAMVILMLPILLGAFGLGFDIARNVYVRTALQGALDMALASGATVTIPDPANPGQLIIDPVEAPLVVQQVYALNRTANVGLRCLGSPPRCWEQPEGPPQVENIYVVSLDTTRSAISYTVREETSNFFLSVVGVPRQTYIVEGTAEITSRNE